MKLHSRGPSQADITEGSSGIWERLHYDWSDPNHVVLTTTDSNTWGGASGHTYSFTRRPDGLTDAARYAFRSDDLSCSQHHKRLAPYTAYFLAH
jgi:hypothetical protein